MMSLATNTQNSIVASGRDDGSLTLWQVELGGLRNPIAIQAHRGLTGGLAFSPNGKLVASTGSDRIIKVWDALTGAHLQSFEGHTDYIPQLIFADDRTIWSRGYDATTRYWDLETGNGEIFTALDPQWVLVLARSIDCQWIAFGSYTPMLSLLYRPTGRLTSYPAAGNRLRQMTFTRDGRSIIGITDDRQLNRWEIERDYLHTSAYIGDRDAMAILPHPSYPHLLICGNDDGTISVWDLDRQMWIDRFQAHRKEINSLAFIDRLNLAISCSVDGAIKVWKFQNYSLVEVYSIDSIEPYQLMQLGANKGLNRTQLTALVQMGATIDGGV